MPPSDGRHGPGQAGGTSPASGMGRRGAPPVTDAQGQACRPPASAGCGVRAPGESTPHNTEGIRRHSATVISSLRAAPFDEVPRTNLPTSASTTVPDEQPQARGPVIATVGSVDAWPLMGYPGDTAPPSPPLARGTSRASRPGPALPPVLQSPGATSGVPPYPGRWHAGARARGPAP